MKPEFTLQGKPMGELIEKVKFDPSKQIIIATDGDSDGDGYQIKNLARMTTLLSGLGIPSNPSPAITDMNEELFASFS